MKAISPSLPTIASARSDSAADSSAADEVFGAVIAAALGATPQPTARSTTNSATRQSDTTSDANRSATTSRVDRSGAVGSSSSVRGDVDDSGAGSGAVVGSTASGGGEAQASGEVKAAQQTGGTTDDIDAKAAADSAAAKAKTAPPAEQTGVGAVAKVASTSVTMLDKASVALARALAALPQDAATSAKLAAAGSTATAEPGDAIPAQLLNAMLKPAPANALMPAKGTGPASQTAIGVPAAPMVAAQAAATDLATSLANSDPVKQPAVAAKTGTAAPQPAAPVVGGADVPPPMSDPTAVTVATAVTAGGQHGGSSSESKDKSQTPAGTAPAPSDLKQSTTENSFAAALQVPNTAPPATIVQAPQQAAQPHAVPVPDQIVQVVAPLRTSGDGNYTISLQLHPADLGAVTVHVSVEQGVLSVHLGSDEAHGRDALTSSISDLRNQLQASGVRVAGIDVGTRASLQQNGAQNPGNQSTAGQGNQSQQQLPQHSHNGHGDRRQDGDPSAFAGWNGNDSGAGNTSNGRGTAPNQQATPVHRGVAVLDGTTRGDDTAGPTVGDRPADDVALDVRI